jgi:hypothetical protein
MPKNDVPKEFFDVVDKFIDLANKLSRKWPTSRISSAMMYAAARYNASNFYTLESNPGRNAQSATEYYCEQYKAMLRENMEGLQGLRPGGGRSKGPATPGGSPSGPKTARRVQCGEHGDCPAAFVCQHLVHGSGLGFVEPDQEAISEDEPDERCAWCSECERVRAQQGGWNDVSEGFAQFMLVCDVCFEDFRRLNRR